ncbi:PucR family transcriptional regulator [Nitriliruptoraceae bacterium ZYF776]|nr:PucR family transcriptional regulator [Profundirhabdus halotolerans]
MNRGRGGGGRLDRSRPLADLPAVLADRSATVAVRDDLPWPRFDADLIDEVVRPAIGDIVERVVAELRGTGPDAEPGGPIERAIRAATDQALRQFAGAVETGSAELHLHLYHELGARHARAGLPLDELLDRFGTGGLVCWRAVVDLHREGRLPEALVPPAGEFVMAFVQELSSAAAAGYAEAASGVEATLRARRTDLLAAVLAGDRTAADLHLVADDLGWRLPDPLRVGSVLPGQAAPATIAWPPTVLAAPVAGRWHVLVPPDADLDGVALGGATVVLGPAVGLDHAAESLLAADQLRSLVVAGAVAGGGVRRTADHTADVLLARSPALVDELVTSRLGPLLELPAHRREPLLATLRAWLGDPGRPSAVAAELHVHPRTVRARVATLRRLLGADLDDPACRLELALATRAAVTPDA